jgi:Zn-dependent protease with chaperone function
MARKIKTTAYRNPYEALVLLLTLFLVAGVIFFTVTATACLSGVFILGFVLFSFYISRSHHQSLVKTARRVTQDNAPGLSKIIQDTGARLQPGELQVFVAPSRALNAYTFGLSSPKIVVLYSGLLGVMDEDELAFIVGHEQGHVALGHTWLNSLVGGMAGIPASWSAGLVMTAAFLWWNRSCEISADRAGLLACGNPEKAVSALVKLGAGPGASTSRDLQEAYREIDAQDDTFMGNLGESLATHPMLIKRIEALRKYVRSAEYSRLQDLVDKNITG